MKFHWLLLSIVSLAWTQVASATAKDFFITCDSINRWSDARPESPPLAWGESWSLEIRNQESGGENYTLKMKHAKNGLVRETYAVPVALTYEKEGSSVYLGLSLGKNQELGRFTVNHLALPFSLEPFIMYGWSKQPLTVTSAMEYRCIIQGVTQSE